MNLIQLKGFYRNIMVIVAYKRCILLFAKSQKPIIGSYMQNLLVYLDITMYVAKLMKILNPL